MRIGLGFVLLLAFLWPGADAQAESGPVKLSVKPVLCITDKRNQNCAMSFLVRWQSEELGFYCLYNDFSAAPLDCWEEESSAALEEDRVVDRSFSYWLTDRNFAVRLAEAMVEVLSLESTDRRRNRRRRHAWSIL